MKALIDTCVVIDFLQKREPFAATSKEIFLQLQPINFQAILLPNQQQISII